MAEYKTVETFRKNNLSGDYDYFLMKAEVVTDNGTSYWWKVMCFEVLKDVENEDCSLEFQWEVMGKVVGYVDNNPNREIREAFTEETAREEFNRWR